jgi:membrane protease YdiL (CAAX protease family)
VFASNNLWEEVAWMGFVQARLQARHGPMRAAAITGPLFALQHISLMFGNPLVVGVIIMVVFAIVAIPFRALLGWAYNSTGSLFIVGLIHAVGNGLTAGSGFFAAGLLPRLYTNDVVGVMHLLSSAVIGLVVIAATRGRLAGGNAARVPPAPSNVASAQT